MRRIYLGVIMASAASLFAVSPLVAAERPLPGAALVHAAIVYAAADDGKISETKAALRDLWFGHAFWVRNVVVAELSGDKTRAAAAEREAVANAQAIATSIEPFYGEAARAQFFELLAGHYGAVKNYLDATMAEDADKQSDAAENLRVNASEIAVFLSDANPYLPKETVEGLLQAHGGHHIAQIQQLVAKNYDGEAQTWAEMTHHLYTIADATGDALVKQFPLKF